MTATVFKSSARNIPDYTPGHGIRQNVSKFVISNFGVVLQLPIWKFSALALATTVGNKVSLYNVVSTYSEDCLIRKV